LKGQLLKRELPLIRLENVDLLKSENKEGSKWRMKPVLKGTSFVLVHVPHIMTEAGTTFSVEREENNDSEFLQNAPNHIRTFEECLRYAPNQAFIGNIDPESLDSLPKPWYEHLIEGERFGKFGEIMPEDEFYALMQIADVFDLVLLEDGFVETIKGKLSSHPLINANDVAKLKGKPHMEIEKQVNENGAIPLKVDGILVGCVRKAHDKDETLAAHVMLENLATKASAILALKHLLHNAQIDSGQIEYIIECSEEACGDMNQRGGGNFAKAIGEIVGTLNATGSDVRGFCAGPAHAILHASSLVASGVFKNVVVIAGGATAKLGMNGKEHVKKGLPLLEDTLGGFGVLISADDGVSPVIRLDSVGAHTVGTGASPQQVMSALTVNPLEKLGLTLSDVDKYAPELQNPEVTEPAGAGDVPKSNYKMIAALAVKRGEIKKDDMDTFINEHGMPGFAPTQGHIPSGVPIMGFAREKIMAGALNRVMVIGKGSLFLSRMTNQFDGVSFLIESNNGTVEQQTGKAADEQKLRTLLADALRDVAQHLRSSEE
jgi:betaine reductase